MVSGLLFSLVLALVPTEGVDSARGVSKDVLAGQTYAFCHETDYPLTPDEAQWCPVLAEAQAAELERCPAFAEACNASRAVLKGVGRLSSRSAENEEQAEKRATGRGPSRGRDEREDEDEDELELPVLGGLAQVLFWLVIGVALILLVAAIVRNLAHSRGVEPDPEPSGDPEPGQELDPDAARIAAAARAMETDVERLLALARQSSQQGAFADAVDFSHAALLRRLDHEGLIRLHASRTNGEYVRELRGNASLVDPVREVLRRVDRAQFGPQGAGASIFGDIHERVLAIVKTVGPLVLLVTTVLGAAMACGPGTDSARMYPWSTSPSGNGGVLELLRGTGVTVSYRTEALTALESEEASADPCIVMLADAMATPEEWAALRVWVQGGGRLVIAGGQLPPWLDVSYATAAVPVAGPPVADAAAVADTETEPASSQLETGAAEAEMNWEELDETDAIPVVLTSIHPIGRTLLVDGDVDEIGLDTLGNTAFASFPWGFGRVEVFADGRLFTNAGIVFGPNAEAIVATMEHLGGTAEFVDGWVTTTGADTPADAIRNSHLTAAVVQLLIFILALYLWRGRQFGRATDPIVQGRRAFSQHAVAMGRQYEKARAASFAARLFSGWVLERLRNRFSSAATAGLLGLSQEVARRSGRDETDVMRLLVAAHSAVESVAGPGGTAEDLALVRDLGRLMREIGETT
ncbi:MAG: DUF4129 domain-containing protein [Nannocystaceae bacterium]|nr:DUF4129 domain-containing protein [Nannocystaceae bacterium]